MQSDKEVNGDSKKPQDTAFRQQRLPAWQPILTPKYVICSFSAIAIVFIAIGAALLVASNNVVELTRRYDNEENCALSGDNFGRICEVTIPIEEPVDLPVFVYYELDNFFQNHRRYVKSRSDSQLRGEVDADASGCDPLETYNGLTLYPCGLIAHSFFSDEIIGAIERGGTNFSLVPSTDYNAIAVGEFSDNNHLDFVYNDSIRSWQKRGIAWQSDIDEKFNLMENLSGDISNLDSTVFTRQGPEQERINNALGLNVTDDGAVLIPSPEDEDLIVWMRTAGLPNFKKLYRRIDSLEDVPNLTGSTGRLERGDTLRFKIRNFFRVSDFDGSKSIVVSTVSFVGGKNDFLGVAYLVVGSAIMLLALAFLVKHLVSPRKLGDMRYFNWNANARRQNSSN